MENLSFIHENISLEEMIGIIADKNDIKKFYLPIYKQEKKLGGYPPELGKIRKTKKISGKNFTNSKIDFEKTRRKKDEVVGIESTVLLEGNKKAHISMLDIDYVLRKANFALKGFNEILTKIYENGYEREGFIIDSGKGFHYYGLNVINPEEWNNFINKAKKIQQIEDEWCKYQLKRGFSVLRTSSSNIKTKKPRVIYRVKERN